MQESVIEETNLDIKRKKLTDLVEDGIVFNQAILDKPRKQEKYILRLEKRIFKLDEWVELEKSIRSEFN